MSNLPAVSRVYCIMHAWTLPSMSAVPRAAQAQDRCHRIGQTRPVHIYRLVSEATIEENILAKSDQKRQARPCSAAALL